MDGCKKQRACGREFWVCSLLTQHHRPSRWRHSLEAAIAMVPLHLCQPFILCSNGQVHAWPLSEIYGQATICSAPAESDRIADRAGVRCSGRSNRSSSLHRATTNAPICDEISPLTSALTFLSFRPPSSGLPPRPPRIRISVIRVSLSDFSSYQHDSDVSRSEERYASFSSTRGISICDLSLGAGSS